MVQRTVDTMKAKPIDILLIEDNPGDERLLREYLRESSLQTGKFVHAERLSEALAHLRKEKFDIVLSDLHLPDSAGIDTFIQLHKEFPLQAVLVLTGFGENDEIGLKAVQLGAQDFLSKNNLNHQVIGRAIKYGLERHQMKRRLEEAQHLARVGSWGLDLSTNELHCSTMVCEIFDRDAGAFSNLGDYINAVHPQDQEKVAMAFKEAFENGKPFRIDHRILFQKEKVTYVVLQGRAQFNSYDRPTTLSGTVQDITDRMRMEELMQQTRMAEERAKLKQEFLAKTSHEIRTPLNPILLLTKMLLESEITTQQREHLSAIKTAGDTLLAVVNDILDLSKIEAGKIDFNRTPFDLAQRFEYLREMLESNAKPKGLNLQFSIEQGIPKYLIGDPVRLTQVLLNLVGNAIKFTHQGSVKVNARALKTEGKFITVRFDVADTGIGIPKENLSGIFDSFRQVENEINSQQGGTGLGLTIVQQLVKLQGGKIFVESTVGEGSLFAFELKFEVGEEQIAPYKESVVIDKNKLRGLNILLVEDNPLNQMVTKAVLSDWGVDVDLAIHGKECLRFLERRSYDLILMDLQMPEMDGYETTRYIRSKLAKPHSETPIIALTANAFTGMDDECMKIGMNDYISKPFQKAVLYEKIGQHARKQDKNMATQYPNGSQRKPLATPVQAAPPIDKPIGKLIDLTYLKEVSAGDNDIIRRAIGKFLETTPETIVQMEQCLIDRAYLDLSKCAHKLKSSVATMGMNQARETMFSIERIGKGTDKLDTLASLVAHGKDVIERASVELEAALKIL